MEATRQFSNPYIFQSLQTTNRLKFQLIFFYQIGHTKYNSSKKMSFEIVIAER